MQTEDQRGHMKEKTRELNNTDKFEHPPKWHSRKWEQYKWSDKNNLKGKERQKLQKKQEIFQKWRMA